MTHWYLYWQYLIFSLRTKLILNAHGQAVVERFNVCFFDSLEPTKEGPRVPFVNCCPDLPEFDCISIYGFYLCHDSSLVSVLANLFRFVGTRFCASPANLNAMKERVGEFFTNNRQGWCGQERLVPPIFRSVNSTNTDMQLL